MPFSFFKIAAFFVLVMMISCKNGNIESFEKKDENGRVSERYERRKSDFAKHGRFQSFYENGTIKEAAFYINDTLDGEQKFFYSNGTCEQIRRLRNGLFEGHYQDFYESGTTKSEGDYRENSMNGTWKYFYKSGTLKEQIEFKNNEENGPFREFYENGVLKAEGQYLTPSEDWEGGKEHGVLKEYAPDGQLIRIANCTTGRCQTTWEQQ